MLDSADAKNSDICQIGDMKLSVGAAANMNLITKKGGDWQLTREGQQFMADRAGSKLESMEAQEVGSSLDGQSQAAIGKLDALTRGRFSSAYLPTILHDHMDGKAPSFEVVQELTKATDASPELIEGMLNELCNKSLDLGARAVGSAEGLSSSQVHKMITDSSKATQKRWLVMAAMGDTKGMQQLVKALRRKDIK